MIANELRIGNWVMNFDKPHKIRDGEDIGDAEIHDCFQPISLTPEILEKAGFVDGFYLAEKFDFGISINFGEDYTTLGQNHETFILPKIKYLHQLQNLYFALTGTELEINLT